MAPGSSFIVPHSSSSIAPSANRLVQTMVPDKPTDVPKLALRQGKILNVDFLTGLVDITIGGASGDEMVPGVKHLSNYRPVPGDPIWLFQSGNDAIVIDRAPVYGPSAITDSGGSWIPIEETTTSTTYTNLATVGPTISNLPVSPSGNILIIIGGLMSNDSTGGAAIGYQMTQTLGLPGNTLTSLPPTLQYSAVVNKMGAGKQYGYTHAHIRYMIPVGVWSITAKYAAYGGGTARFNFRTLSVIPL